MKCNYVFPNGSVRELAELNIIPDEIFSDSDCCLWSFFKEGCV